MPIRKLTVLLFHGNIIFGYFHCLKPVLWWFDTVLYGPYVPFSIGVLQTFPYSDRCGKYASFYKKIEAVWLRTFARNFSNIDFFLKILPLKDGELAMSEM